MSILTQLKLKQDQCFRSHHFISYPIYYSAIGIVRWTSQNKCRKYYEQLHFQCTHTDFSAHGRCWSANDANCTFHLKDAYLLTGLGIGEQYTIFFLTVRPIPTYYSCSYFVHVVMSIPNESVMSVMKKRLRAVNNKKAWILFSIIKTHKVLWGNERWIQMTNYDFILNTLSISWINFSDWWLISLSKWAIKVSEQQYLLIQLLRMKHNLDAKTMAFQ